MPGTPKCEDWPVFCERLGGGLGTRAYVVVEKDMIGDKSLCCSRQGHDWGQEPMLVDKDMIGDKSLCCGQQGHDWGQEPML